MTQFNDIYIYILNHQVSLRENNEMLFQAL